MSPTVRPDANGIPDDITLRGATASADTVDGTAKILFQVPAAGRFLNAGKLWFCGTPHKDDRIKIDLVNVVNGVEVPVGSFVDSDVPAQNQGLRIPLRTGEIESKNIMNLQFIPGGVWIRVVGMTGDQRQDTLCVNVGWGASTKVSVVPS